MYRPNFKSISHQTQSFAAKILCVIAMIVLFQGWNWVRQHAANRNDTSTRVAVKLSIMAFQAVEKTYTSEKEKE